jgi:hypothetical protein
MNDTDQPKYAGKLIAILTAVVAIAALIAILTGHLDTIVSNVRAMFRQPDASAVVSTATAAPSPTVMARVDIGPVLSNPSGRLQRIANNDHCQGNENNWVYITEDKSVKIGLVGVNLTEGRVDIRVIQTRDGKTTRDDRRLYRDRTLGFGVGNFEMYIKPQIDDCWVDYEIYPTSK